MTLDEAKKKYGITEIEFRLLVADGIILREIDFEMAEDVDRNIAKAKRYVLLHTSGERKLELLKKRSPSNGNSKGFNQNTNTSTFQKYGENDYAASPK